MTSHREAAPKPLSAEPLTSAPVNIHVPKKMMTPHPADTPTIAGISRIRFLTASPPPVVMEFSVPGGVRMTPGLPSTTMNGAPRRRAR